MGSQKDNFYVVNHPEGWAVKKANAEKSSRVFDTQKEAQQYARERAINSHGEVVTQGKNGQFRQKNSYGNDPFPPEG